MSSRSLAAARARRAGENAPPVSGNRPGTSIGSHAAFAPQQQTAPAYNHNAQPNNVRTGRPGQQQQQQMPPQPPQKQQSAAYQQVQQSQQQEKKALPFTKLSISDAIGLITLRLGRVEQWVIDTEHENHENEENGNNYQSGSLNLPDNSKIIDSSILTNIISRIDSLEKREPGTNNPEEITKLSESVTKLTEQIGKIVEEGNKHSLAISKHTEQLFKFDRDLVETKDLLKTFMIKYDMFTSETNNKFADYEFALSELENNVKPVEEAHIDDKVDGTSISDIDNNEVSSEIASSIMSVDLKNIIKQELAASGN
jgi:hypothetical protein